MAHLDIRVMVWERYEIDTPEQLAEIKAKLERGEITTGEDLSVDYDISMNYIDDTSTDMDVSDNDGWATQELFDDEGNLIWANAKSEAE